MTKSPLCPCGSTLLDTDCCRPILADHHRAKTALALMRSRYTAFAEKHEKHILASWNVKNRPDKLNFDNHPVVWLGLEVHDTQDGTAQDNTGMVEFTATYLENGQIARLREKSRFCKEDDLWYYLGGEIDVKRQKVERNGACPCGSGKKFKRCCLEKSLV